ncbi:LEAF RUST 10 DISEASE-RESISTANCE LOCUS RECEPTOR-LIKE PROTEIN KINASE-like 1.3 [Cardamine amara subsp. amara]|uniref:LEAF RUST 10 DISEASE-RESISTANCE LOCUS RECEPTOR-LIKE PROTEIN KINASE-like 1.3 n=1 Tax=Cardamine amara subsp. amara TaxID=228776 RepID=A0ABD0ZBP6_CARAN
MVLFRFSKLNSCLVLLFFLFSLHHIPCALSQREPNLCDTLFQCGNLTAGFPFWGEARPEPCGHPSLVLHCNHNNTSLIISGQVYRILLLMVCGSLHHKKDCGESFSRRAIAGFEACMVQVGIKSASSREAKMILVFAIDSKENFGSSLSAHEKNQKDVKGNYIAEERKKKV